MDKLTPEDRKYFIYRQHYMTICDEINKNNRIKLLCPCGKYINRQHKSRHIKTEFHKENCL